MWSQGIFGHHAVDSRNTDQHHLQPTSNYCGHPHILSRAELVKLRLIGSHTLLTFYLEYAVKTLASQSTLWRTTDFVDILLLFSFILHPTICSFLYSFPPTFSGKQDQALRRKGDYLSSYCPRPHRQWTIDSSCM